MEHPAHASPKRGIDRLMLLDATHSAKAFRADPCRIMVSVASEIGNLDLRIGYALSNQVSDLVGGHCHDDQFP